MDFIEMGSIGDSDYRNVAESVAELVNSQRGTSGILQEIIDHEENRESDDPSWRDDDETETDSDEDQIYYEKHDRAQEEWDESMRQLQGLVQLMLIPIIGKYLGRRFAYYAWKRYIDWKT